MLELLIQNGLVIDGTGTSGMVADVGISRGEIVDIGPLGDVPASQKIDAAGMVVCPGFIDIHSHSDFTLLLGPEAQSKVRQGVTTEVTGNCGASPAPLTPAGRDVCLDSFSNIARHYAANLPPEAWQYETLDGFYEAMFKQGAALNVAPLVGHSTLRSNVMAYAAQPPRPDELAQMKYLLEAELEKGAFGLSSGLIYHPGAFARTPELTELAAVVQARNGIYTTHMRSEGRYLFEAIDETIDVARQSGVSLQISHFKCEAPAMWGCAPSMLQRIDQARELGLDVTFDLYPYTAYGSGLQGIFPTWAIQDGLQGTLQRLNDPASRAQIAAQMGEPPPEWENPMEGLDWDQVLITGFKRESYRRLNGCTVARIAETLGLTPIDTVMQIFIAEKGLLGMLVFSMDEGDLQALMQHPAAMVASDGSAVDPDGPCGKSPVHPRYYGCFPRVLGRYVREKKVLSLELAIHKMTGMPANKLGLKRRGTIARGMAADIVVLDPDQVVDRADFKNPHQFPGGIFYVLINGRMVINKGRHTGLLPGQRLSPGV